jgi:hypothetical protein
MRLDLAFAAVALAGCLDGLESNTAEQVDDLLALPPRHGRGRFAAWFEGSGDAFSTRSWQTMR